MAEDQIIIDGMAYDMPDTFTIGEARTLKKYTGLNLSDLEGADTSDPNFMAAVIHIAFARKFPNVSYAEIEARVDKVSLESIDTVMAEEPADPPTVAPSLVNGASESPTGGIGAAVSESSPVTLSPVSSGARP